MTLQALSLPKKADPSPDRREQVLAATVYGETGENAMNDGLTEMHSVALFTGGRALNVAM
ncbi:hypothetical protein B5K05_30280 [Rhizobium phaseoli]|uniref:hypothetical protein n=1 Tax=Rhizobium phaseoli TaxID=396 RepID=UPI0002F7A1C2|nr:hypothetical protein [Rhizobium phaseoli]KKZ85089.1 hypothetical protein RPHASCH2410_PB01750 [Rhizobium phaseoli Ch24-10]RDJ02338.1 hypothetical protein B5K05_30280 [Rhizobium phaseoli]RDJ02840.1 hypothetical protein B5K04_27655 [Rhizobium phaseoli]